MKIMSVVGARPPFIKAATFRKGCEERGIEEILFHTGQHYDFNMSSVFFDELGVKPPDFTHDLKSRKHGGMTGELLTVLEAAFLEQKPDVVNVYGDTNTTLAAALAASKLHIPVSHIEAGLRSFNKKMPEETNRVLTDHVSQYLFCPTSSAVDNLRKENIRDGVVHVGDIMHDSVLMFKDKFVVPDFVRNIRSNKELAVLTIHRAESLNEQTKLKKIIDYCKGYLSEYVVVFAIHPNTKNMITKFNIDLTGFLVVEPLPYLQLQGLISASSLVLTDSGGLQKEAYFHRVPCITLRDETEWVETVENGWNRLWKSNTGYNGKNIITEYGKGDTTSKILDMLIANKSF